MEQTSGAAAGPRNVYSSIVTIDETSTTSTPSQQTAPMAPHAKSQIIPKKGASIPTSDGTIHVQPFRRSGSKQLKALVTFVPRSSAFDSSEAGADQFRGFFTLFWIFLFVFSVRTFVYSQETMGKPLSFDFAAHLSKDLFTLLLSDGVLFAASLLAVPFVKAMKHGYITYYWTGAAIQHTYQTLMLGLAIKWTFDRQWPWVQSGYFTLRCLVLLMKMHSYISVNGFLQSVNEQAQRVEAQLRRATDKVGGWEKAISDAKARREELDGREFTPSDTPSVFPTKITSKTSASYFSSTTEIGTSPDSLRHRLQHLQGVTVAGGVDGLAQAIKESVSDRPVSANGGASPSSSSNDGQPMNKRRPIDSASPPAAPTTHALVDHPTKEISELAKVYSECQDELTSTGPNQVVWPQNITWWNYLDYQFLPTLVYELEYPRTNRIRPLYVLEKTVATFGTFFLLYQYTEHYILPLVPTKEQSFFRSMIDLALPFMVCYLILFYLIFECICNGFAELSRFADRQFYEDWWNATSWDQFARKWNKPVHIFLLKHVYASTLSYKGMSKGSATFVTFLLSACVHELVMAIVTKKIRLYLFVLQMAQLPLIAIGRIPAIKRNKILGNLVFWVGLMAGFPLLCVAYCAY